MPFDIHEDTPLNLKSDFILIELFDFTLVFCCCFRPFFDFVLIRISQGRDIIDIRKHLTDKGPNGLSERNDHDRGTEGKSGGIETAAGP